FRRVLFRSVNDTEQATDTHGSDDDDENALQQLHQTGVHVLTRNLLHAFQKRRDSEERGNNGDGNSAECLNDVTGVVKQPFQAGLVEELRHNVDVWVVYELIRS